MYCGMRRMPILTIIIIPYTTCHAIQYLPRPIFHIFVCDLQRKSTLSYLTVSPCFTLFTTRFGTASLYSGSTLHSTPYLSQRYIALSPLVVYACMGLVEFCGCVCMCVGSQVSVFIVSACDGLGPYNHTVCAILSVLYFIYFLPFPFGWGLTWAARAAVSVCAETRALLTFACLATLDIHRITHYHITFLFIQNTAHASVYYFI